MVSNFQMDTNDRYIIQLNTLVHSKKDLFELMTNSARKTVAGT